MSGWSALVRPIRKGYYAVVTDSTHATEIIDRQIKARVEWVAARDQFTGLHMASLSDFAPPMPSAD